MDGPYANTLEYLREFLALLALRLHRQVLLTRLVRGAARDEAFLGLFLSEDEVNGILAELHGATLSRNGQVVGLKAEAATLATRIEKRLVATPDLLRPQRLAEIFALSPWAVEVLLLLLAPEMDSRFGQVFAYLQNDVTRRWLSPGLALELLPGTDPDDPAGRALFAAGSPLIGERLVLVGGEDGVPPPPLVDRPLKLDDRVAEYLLGHDPLDPRLAGVATLAAGAPRAAPGDRPASGLASEPALHSQLAHLAALWQQGDGPPAFFWGRPGSGKAVAAAALARQLGRPLLTVDAVSLARRPAEKTAGLLHRAGREIQLRQAIVHVRDAEALDEQGRRQLLHFLRPGLLLSSRELWPLHELEAPPLVIHFAVPGYELRRVLWDTALDGHPSRNGRLPATLAGRFRLTLGQINQAVQAAQHRAWLRGGPQASPDRADLFEGCRLQSNPALDRLATKVASPYTWDDLVLPGVQMSQLRAIEGRVRHAATVYSQWGFEGRLPQGKGINALFSGESGTGKTMAAGILAKSLGLDMYKIDLSGVVSKYIGETEKNLHRIFEEAATANVVLFFDEADALFGKRSEVKDAHDRYANIEISYLLQKMEEYEGVTILASNLKENIDEAFTRRLQFIVDFPFPQAANRRRIWSGLFPAQAPRSDDVDLDFLAAQFELTGGHIKNCVLAAAFLAAEEETAIAMRHLIQGVARELAKMGRPLQKSDFAEYFALARREQGQ